VSEETTQEASPGRKVSISFERKRGLADFGNVTAWAHVEDYVPLDASESQVAETLNSLFNAAKAATFDQLGIEFVMDEHGVLREKHEPVANVSDAASAVGRQFPNTTNDGGLRVMNKADQQGDIPQPVIDFCAARGITAIWDNRKQGKSFSEAVGRGKVSLINGTSKGALIGLDGTFS